MDIGRLQKLFGVGPLGAAISVAVLSAAAWTDHRLGHVAIMGNPAPLKVGGGVLAIIGLVLFAGSLWTICNGWAENELCTRGPFKWFRHPMYAAWISFIFPGITLYFNSWIILAAAVLLHPVWHRLVRREERMMLDTFQDQYRAYAARTGRFVPRVGQR